MSEFEAAPFLQQTDHPDREAPAGASVSDDAKASVAETARLQAAAQQRIDAGRHDTIGSAP
jgi:hypothetical protein